MPDIPQLVAAIDGRLAELAGEIAALQSAKAALDGARKIAPSPAGPAGAMTARSSVRQRPPRRTRSPAPTPSAAAGATSEPVISADGGGRARKRSGRKVSVKGTRRRAGVAVGSETLERVLADALVGLSATVIAERAGAGYGATLRLLRELEAAGEVRRSGSRRSTVWRLVTDEERIAERAAELERRRSIPGRQRRGARAT